MLRSVLNCVVALAICGLAHPVSALPQTANGDDTRAHVAERMVKIGLTQDEAEARVARLTDQDLRVLAANPQQVAMGAVEDKTLITIAIIVTIPAVIVFLAVLL